MKEAFKMDDLDAMLDDLEGGSLDDLDDLLEEFGEKSKAPPPPRNASQAKKPHAAMDFDLDQELNQFSQSNITR